MYVSELVVPGTVNTMPASTLDEFADHGHVPAAAPVADTYASAAAHFEELGRTGIDFRSRRTTTPWCRSCSTWASPPITPRSRSAG